MSERQTVCSTLFVILVWVWTPTGQAGSVPVWISELQAAVGKSLKTEVRVSSTIAPDEIEGKEYKVIRLAGEGSLQKVPNPFHALDQVFRSEGWKNDLRYDADGHGSSSSAFRKQEHFCITRIMIDSSDDDEETGHIPSVFSFEIDCRDIETSGHN